MNEILPAMRDLIENYLIGSTVLTESIAQGEGVLTVDNATYFMPGDEVTINDDIYLVHSKNNETNKIQLTDSIGHSLPAGQEIIKLRAANPPLILVGDFIGAPNSLPAVQISGTSTRVEPLTIGAQAWIHEVYIDVIGENNSQGESYQDMLDLAKYLQNILLRYRTLCFYTSSSRYFYKTTLDIDYGNFEFSSVILSAARLTFTLFEEAYLNPLLEPQIECNLTCLY